MEALVTWDVQESTYKQEKVVMGLPCARIQFELGHGTAVSEVRVWVWSPISGPLAPDGFAYRE